MFNSHGLVVCWGEWKPTKKEADDSLAKEYARIVKTIWESGRQCPCVNGVMTSMECCR
jgi:hypothetical protein